MGEHLDVVIVGAGAAGLMAGIWAGRTRPEQRVLILDGARKIGAKILVSGGGRCNVTHHRVDADRFAGASPAAIRKVLRRFEVSEVIRFFDERGVQLKREQTGKLFPVSDSARTVLNALLEAVRTSAVGLQHPSRVTKVSRESDHFRVEADSEEILSRRVILATGGCSLPKSGSDGYGYEIAKSLGHTLTDAIHPALVPLILAEGHFVRSLSGLTLVATLELRSGTGKRIKSISGSTLCTHFGLSGPAVLDISRYFIAARRAEPDAHLVINWTGERTEHEVDAELQQGRKGKIRNHLARALPDRLAGALLAASGLNEDIEFARLSRAERRALVTNLCAMPLPITGDRGFNYAEVTAGGVPLSELDLQTMESRRCPGLFLCGEICDVDGPIGGFNFQWAWASGYVAGVAVAR